MKLNLEAAYNPLSFGQIAYGVTNSLFKLGVDLNIFPIHGNADVSAFDKNGEFFNPKIKSSIENRYLTYSNDIPSLRIWHILDSEGKVSKNNSLLTFHETDQITEAEKNVLNSFNRIFVTSNYTKNIFEEGGVTVPVFFIPMGIELTQYYKLNKKYLEESICCWNLTGKVENRKKTKLAIRGWCKKFAGNNKHRLNLFTHNTHLTPEQNNALYADIFQGQQPPWNVQIFGPQQYNSQMNDAFNATSIVIDISGGEALSLPSLNMVGLGKHALIHNCTAMKDWATPENSTLIESVGMEPAVDNVFFHAGGQNNQGNFFSISENDYLDGLDKVYQKWKLNPINEEGLKLRESHSFDVGTQIILKEILN